jgi:hypothetical protein
MPSAAAAPQDLSSRDPRRGDRLQFRGASWKVTEESSYDNEAGYRCVEWTCLCGDVEGYLLKETEKDRAHRWFFTLTLDAGKVKLPTGQSVGDHIAKSGDGLKTKETPALVYRGQTYMYADKTEGTYTDDEGDRTPKTTWDLWDAAHKNNLAVEIWESGEVDCYLGNYIEASGIVYSTRPNLFSDHEAFASGTLKFAGYVALFAFWAIALGGGPLDVFLTIVIGVVLLAGWMYPVMDAAPVAAASASTAAALGVLFWLFPPFTTAVGLTAMAAAPAFLACVVRRSDHTLSDQAARVHIAYALEIPLICVGLHAYFEWAPAPHDFFQYCLAIAPALAGGVVSWCVTTLMFSDFGPLGAHVLHDGGPVS